MCCENANTFDIKIISRSCWMWLLLFFSQLPQIASELSKHKIGHLTALKVYTQCVSLNPNLYQSDYLFSSPYKDMQLVHSFLWQAKLLFDSRALQLFSVVRLTVLTAWMTSLGNAWDHQLQPAPFQPFAFNDHVVNARKRLWKKVTLQVPLCFLFSC